MRAVTALLLAAALAACAPQPQTQVAAVRGQSPPPPPRSDVDGRYRGTARLTRADNPRCPRSGPRLLEVQNGQVTLSYAGDVLVRGGLPERVPLTAGIGPDGRIRASDGVGTMEGEWRDGQLGLTIASRLCEHRWNLTRVD